MTKLFPGSPGPWMVEEDPRPDGSLVVKIVSSMGAVVAQMKMARGLKFINARVVAQVPPSHSAMHLALEALECAEPRIKTSEAIQRHRAATIMLRTVLDRIHGGEG